MSDLSAAAPGMVKEAIQVIKVPQTLEHAKAVCCFTMRFVSCCAISLTAMKLRSVVLMHVFCLRSS